MRDTREKSVWVGGLCGLGLALGGCSGEGASSNSEESEALRSFEIPFELESAASPTGVIAGSMRIVGPGKEVLDQQEDLAAVVTDNLDDLKDPERKTVVGAVEGADYDNEYQVQRKHLVALDVGTISPEQAAERNGDQPLEAPTFDSRFGLDPALQDLIDQGEGEELVLVTVDLVASPTTRLQEDRVMDLATFRPLETDRRAERAAAIAVRKDECLVLNAELMGKLDRLGATDIESFWLTCDLAANMTPEAARSLAADPRVDGIHLSRDLPTSSASDWDGTDLADADGLNVEVLRDDNYDGGFINPDTSQEITIAVQDLGFQVNHPIFDDWQNGPSRVRGSWDCTNNPCTSGGISTASAHGTQVAAIAAGDLMQNQITGFSASQQLNRTGAARESEILMFERGGIPSTIRAIQKAVSEGADIFVDSSGGSDNACDGVSGGFEDAAHQAYEAGTFVVVSAGNTESRPGQSCTLKQIAESPSAFAVGGLENTTAANYDSVDRWCSGGAGSCSSVGPINVTIDGTGTNQQYTAVDAMAPYWWDYGANNSSGLGGAIAGTSFAAPQVAGAAAVVKDWFLDNGFFINSKGRLHTAMLAMTDRASSSTNYANSRFSDDWGGGRFQTRYYHNDDHSGVWGWESVWFEMEADDIVEHEFRGSGTESSNLNQFKAYMVFFEEDGSSVADITMQVRDQNCGAGSSVLRSDTSFDHKKMVRLTGGQAAGEALCIRLQAYEAPSPRRVQLFMYYSASTDMR